MAALGDIFGIAHVLKRAYDLYQGCASAPEEIRLACDHVHVMALCLEGVHSDIVSNKSSFVHQHTAVAKSQTHRLKVKMVHCEKALRRMEALLKKYTGFKHVSAWNRFRWSTEGKKEIAEAKSDLVFATNVLDMFLKGIHLNVLWKVEAMIEALTTKFAGLDVTLPTTTPPTGQKRPRAQSNVTRTIIISLVLARLRKVLRTYRSKKTGKAGTGKKPNPGPRRPKTITRTNSSFAKNTKRNTLINSYATNLASDPPPPYTPRPHNPRRPRTPNPDFHYIPRPIRRTSSLNRLTATTKKPHTPRGAEYFECWRVGIGTLAFGAKIKPEFVQHKRGQLQLRKMGEVFREAGQFSDRALTEKSRCVDMMLKRKNKEEKDKKGGRKWYFVGGRVFAVDAGRTGMVRVEKAFLVVVRR
ncbi:hypothetical protein K458DRAFT_421632 [Lentithecium fluviatile CBS 122367]|uniref:Fungal N-terminal domain-containing protein n=1 Tax=Lentithecium fluviatile CBS 122367 TaxID=1168545 RepID=A0A6G1IR06_9PLEO|nr:hypothetical protein K458DRAFT_421632 [Lentithecium fluviatile CBS 122367]